MEHTATCCENKDTATCCEGKIEYKYSRVIYKCKCVAGDCIRFHEIACNPDVEDTITQARESDRQSSEALAQYNSKVAFKGSTRR